MLILAIPAQAAPGKMFVQLDRPEIHTLRYCGETGEWKEARAVSSMFELDFGQPTPINVQILARAASGPFQDWVVSSRILYTERVSPVPSVHAQLELAYPRVLLMLAVPLGLLLWRRSRPRIVVEQEPRFVDPDSLRLDVEYGGYRLVAKLGSGGGADVYLGQNDSGEHAALKLYRGADLEDRERFRREVKLTRRLKHPNIVSLYDYGEKDDGRVYLILELLTGGRLRERMNGPLPPPAAAELLRPLFLGTAYAHTHGMVHRDLKPENALFHSSGQLKITDFGLAKTRDSHTVTQEGVAMGSPTYMAPEQIRGASRDPAIDQYALGVISFEMLTGEPPYVCKENNIQVIYQHLSAEVPAMPGVSPEIARVVRRMLDKEIALRYPSVSEAWEALERALLPTATPDDDVTTATAILENPCGEERP